MINLDDRIFEQIKDESQMWLLLHIAKRINKDMSCFPTNYTLSKDCGWGMNKTQKIKRQLKKLGLIDVLKRTVKGKQRANIYKVTTDYIGVFVSLKKIHEAALNAVTLNEVTLNKGTLNKGNLNKGNISINNKEVLTTLKVLTNKEESVNKLPPQAQPKELKAEKVKVQISTKNKTLNLQTKVGETLNEQPNNKKIPYFSEFSEIMTHLTKATGKKFRLGKTTSQIKKSDKYLKVVARLKESYTVTDFLNVIGIKCREWLEDAKMSRFLRPSTLFAAKNFEKYLDEYENQSKTIVNYENYKQQPTNNSRRANRRNGAISQEFSDNIENSLKAFYARTNGDGNGANC